MSDILLGVIQDVLNGPEMEPALRPVLGNFHVEITRVLLVKFLFCSNYEHKSVLSNMCWIIYLAPGGEIPQTGCGFQGGFQVFLVCRACCLSLFHKFPAFFFVLWFMLIVTWGRYNLINKYFIEVNFELFYLG